MMSDQSCATCKYSVNLIEGGSALFQCRRFPPQLANYSHSVVIGRSPQVCGTHWCGEWQEIMKGVEG